MSTMNKRRLGGIGAGAAAAVMVLTACSGTPDGGAAAAGGEDAPDGATTIQFWQTQYTDEENAWYEDIVESFNESQDDVHVRLTVVPGDAWEQRMTAAQAAGNAPDLYTANYGNIPDAARTGQLHPLGDLISADAWSDLQENVHGMVTVDGDEYACPLLVEPSSVLYYRTDLFDQAGSGRPAVDLGRARGVRRGLDHRLGLRVASRPERQRPGLVHLGLSVQRRRPPADQ